MTFDFLTSNLFPLVTIVQRYVIVRKSFNVVALYVRTVTFTIYLHDFLSARIYEIT